MERLSEDMVWYAHVDLESEQSKQNREIHGEVYFLLKTLAESKIMTIRTRWGTTVQYRTLCCFDLAFWMFFLLAGWGRHVYTFTTFFDRYLLDGFPRARMMLLSASTAQMLYTCYLGTFS